MRTGATLQVETPEGIVFSLPLAGPLTRAVAVSVDFLVVNALLGFLSQGIGVLQVMSEDWGTAVWVLVSFAISTGYSIACEWLFQGRTLGKRLLGLRVLDERGLQIRFSQVVLRNVLRLADVLPLMYGLGGCVSWLSPRCQRLGDLAAGTVVTREVEARVPWLERVLEGRPNSFREHPLLEARLRRAVTGDEARYALAALVRRPLLEDEAALRLFREMAGSFRARVVFPEEITRTLSDEQYVRNVVDTLYRPRMAEAWEGRNAGKTGV